MDTQTPTHLVINWIDIENSTVLVGATDNLRWKWDTEEGMSGADAFSFVCAEVEFYPSHLRQSPNRKATFHCDHENSDGLMSLATKGLADLFKIAYKIKDQNLTLNEAREKYFGLEIFLDKK